MDQDKSITNQQLNQKDAKSSNKDYFYVIISLSLLALLGLGFGVYGSVKSKRLEEENQQIIQDYALNFEKYGCTQSKTVSDDGQCDNDTKTREWMLELFAKALEDVDSGSYSYEKGVISTLSPAYQPPYLLAAVSSYGTRNDIVSITAKNNDVLNHLKTTISQELADQGFEIIEGLKENGFLNRKTGIVCGEVSISTRNNASLICGDYNKIPSEDSEYTKTINGLYKAYKNKMSEEPGIPFLVNDAYPETVSLYNDYGVEYVIAKDLLGFQEITYFYKKYDQYDQSPEWKFSGKKCEDIESEEEKSLFICYNGQIEIRGGF